MRRASSTPPDGPMPDGVCAVGNQSCFVADVNTAWPVELWAGVHVIAAVSGGADSVAMLRALVELKHSAGGPGELIVAHYNHRLRGAAADADADWVRHLSDELGVPCRVGRPTATPTRDDEQTARDDRYRFLQRVAGGVGARFVATAHTADDQVETLLLRLMRGTGIAGLAGIPPCRLLRRSLTIVRPLLGAWRSEVLSALAGWRQEFRTDATNASLRYARNRVRHELLPRLRERFGDGVDASLLRVVQQAAATQRVVEDEARRLLAEALIAASPSGELHFRADPLSAAAPLLACEAIKLAWRDADWPEQAMGRQHWQQLHDATRGPEAAAPINLPGDIRAHRDGGRLCLRRLGLTGFSAGP